MGFGDDEPCDIEALLIYLHTLEYPNRKSLKFEEPTPKVSKSTPAPASSDVFTDVFTDDPLVHALFYSSGLDKERAMNVGRFKLKSEAPQESWQERLAVYRITHRLGLTSFAKTSLRIMTKGINKALSSSDVDQFTRGIQP